MLDLTSALYLGFRHPTGSLRGWTEFTEGRPAALGEPAATNSVAARLALLTGCESALLAPSTLHLFWDIFGTPQFRGRPIFLDSGAYPIARWGVERARCTGSVVATFRHHDPRSLRKLLARLQRRASPVIVCDGLCPSCGGSAPLREYAALAERAGASLLIDDTQALGVLGAPAPGALYGTGGGGSLRNARLAGANVLVVASLAKGFGTPLAVLAGQRATVEGFERASDTRVHCSPVSAAVLSAAEHALDVNGKCCISAEIVRWRANWGQGGFKRYRATRRRPTPDHGGHHGRSRVPVPF